MATVLKLEHVNFTRAGKPILKDLNWEIQSGENWAVLGLNGAGKTTLLKLLHGDIWPSSGQMEVLGHVFGHSNINDLRKKIGWVSNALQDWLHPGDSAESIVLSGKFASIGVYEETTPAEQATAVDLLKRVGGGSLLGKPYRILSQGEKQLVMIARALMAQPELLILDEPCNGLDLFARDRLLANIEKIAADPASPAMLIVSHHTEELLPCFQKVLLLKDGSIFDQGSRQAMFTEDELTEFYGAPVKVLLNENDHVLVYLRK